MNLLRLSLNLLRRDCRAGEWRVLLLALVLAVGSLATVGLFADRVRQALQQEAQSLIGADMRITSMRPFPPGYRAAAQARGLQTAMSLSFPRMVVFGGESLLSEIQLVEAGYPLRGRITIDPPSPPAPLDETTSHSTKLPNTAAKSLVIPQVGEGSISSIPAPGTIWASQRLLRRLGIRLGEEVGIGRQRFIVAAAIVRDVDQSIGFASFAPRVLLNAQDLAATGLDQEGSRINYRLLIAGDARQVAELRDDLKSRLTDYQKLEDVRDARPEIRTALERAEHFLGLAALTAAILAGAAMALAARRFVLRHLDTCAVMRCLGARQGQVLRLFLYQFLLLGVVAVLLGCALGYATQAVLVGFIESMRDAELPQPTVLPALKAAASGFFLLLGFAFLPLLQLRKVSPLRVLRRELGAPQTSTGMVYGLAVLVLAGLFLWHAGSFELGFAMLGGLLAGLLLFGGLARVLLQSWQGKLPPDTPNRFVVGIQPDQQQPVLDFFARQAVPQPQLLPMVRARLVAINAAPINGDSYPDSRARELVEREFNLSWAEHMPGWNELVQGQWWDTRGQKGARQAQLSVEEGIADRLGIRLGDELTYDVAGSRFTARVTSLRKVQWDSMRVNFFVITTPELLGDYPVSYLTSFHLPPDKIRVGDQLTREFPNLLVIDTGALIEQVRSIMDQIAQTVTVVFLFTLASGLAVLYAALLATQDERIREAAILRTLGADGRYLRRLHLGEFAALGLLSGLFSAGGAVLLGWVLARFVLEIPYHASTVIWLAGGLGGMLVVMLAGWLGTRRLTVLPPLVILRE